MSTVSHPLVVIEGIDGAGKTTVRNSIIAFLESQGHSVFSTRQPGVGMDYDTFYTALRKSENNPAAQALLFAYDRAEHCQKVVLPALAHSIVVSDRWYYSSLAYQGYGLGLPLAWVREINAYGMLPEVPTLVIYLSIDPGVAFERIQKTRGTLEAYEDKGIAFYTRVHEGFIHELKAASHVAYIDAAQPASLVAEQACSAITSFLTEYYHG